jgi:hypothetical protein
MKLVRALRSHYPAPYVTAAPWPAHLHKQDAIFVLLAEDAFPHASVLGIFIT